MWAKNNSVENFVFIGSPILGMEWNKEGEMVVCATDKGLLLVTKDKKVKVLSTGTLGRPFKVVNNVDVASNGRIYFSDATDKFPLKKYYLEGLEMGLHGRLLVYDPKLEMTDIVIDSLAFANGVALSKEEDFVLVSDTYRTRVVRYWLKGPKMGTADIFLDNLPGYPDNINANGDGTFWIALAGRRSESFDFFQGLPLVKNALAKLPKWSWFGFVEKGGWVLKINGKGKIIESLEDSKGKVFRFTTSAREREGKVYFSSFLGDYIGVYEFP